MEVNGNGVPKMLLYCWNTVWLVAFIRVFPVLCLARVIGVWDAKVDLVDSCLEETGGLGVDIVIDSGGKKPVGGCYPLC